jgi:hypothetical protein
MHINVNMIYVLLQGGDNAMVKLKGKTTDGTRISPEEPILTSVINNRLGRK